MADQSDEATGDELSQNELEEASGQPRINVLNQYIKDFSFENPLGPDAATAIAQNPDVKVEINTNARPLENDTHEVTLFIRGEATSGDTVLFIAELTYGGVFHLENVPEESLGAALLIEGARLLFPFARNIVADSTRDGGFPPLMINPIDFVALYRDQHMKANEGGEAD
ncbi:MAG: protein-export chaperone SecB [Alphaproteobacteria bacterium]